MDVLDALRSKMSCSTSAPPEFGIEGVDVIGSDRPDLGLPEPRQDALLQEALVLGQRGG